MRYFVLLLTMIPFVAVSAQDQEGYYSLDDCISYALENNQQVEIANYPSELLRLKLVGVGKILTGIYILLFAILMALIMMPIRLGKIIKGKK